MEYKKLTQEDEREIAHLLGRMPRCSDVDCRLIQRVLGRLEIVKEANDENTGSKV